MAAVGFRVKSGWAVAVLLAGSATEPKVVDCRRVQLADPDEPDSVQPYHAGLDLPAGEGAEAVARLVKMVERFGSRSVAELLEHYEDGGHQIAGVGIVGGSVVDPARMANDHIRAHAEEGRLFRKVIDDAAKSAGFVTAVTVEKQLLAKAATVLGRPEAQLKNEVTALRRHLGGPWRAEQKAATLVAWMLL